MSGYGVITEVPIVRVLTVEGVGMNVIQAAKRRLESCVMISRNLNGLLSGR